MSKQGIGLATAGPPTSKYAQLKSRPQGIKLCHTLATALHLLNTCLLADLSSSLTVALRKLADCCCRYTGGSRQYNGAPLCI